MTTITHPPIESHQTHSRRLIRHAEERLALGDRLQTSEKAWGSVAHYLKVIADRRGWRYETHTQAFHVARALAAEQANPRIAELFAIAEGLHKNYYIDAVPFEFLSDNLENVRELLNILENVEPMDEPAQEEIQ